MGTFNTRKQRVLQEVDFFEVQWAGIYHPFSFLLINFIFFVNGLKGNKGSQSGSGSPVPGAYGSQFQRSSRYVRAQKLLWLFSHLI